MNDLNSVTLIGRLTRDAEIRFTNTGVAISKFAIAVNRSVKKGDKWEDEASFIDCTWFGKAAEALNQYMTKGKQIAIDGELRQSRWEKDGATRSKVEVIANNVQLLGGKADSKPSATSQGQPSQGFESDIPF